MSSAILNYLLTVYSLQYNNAPRGCSSHASGPARARFPHLLRRANPQRGKIPHAEGARPGLFRQGKRIRPKLFRVW